MLCRVWLLGRELFTVQIVRQDPTELLASAIAEHTLDGEPEDEPEPEAQREVTDFFWPPPPEPEEGQRIIFTSQTSDELR